MNEQMVSELQAGLAQRDKIISKLMERVEAMELKSKKSSKSTKGSTSKVSAGKKNASKVQAAPQVIATPPTQKNPISASSNKKTLESSNKKTPIKQCARSETPVSAKKSPLQITKQDHPAGFEHTKFFQDAFYVHIKLLWGLIVKGSIPVPPLDAQLRAFYQRFGSTTEIESAIVGGPSLLAFDMIETLKKARESRSKVGKHMLHMSEFNIRYIHSSLSRLGLVAWIPNLDEQADSLYNVAHQIAAIKTFRECVSGGAYTFMNVNATYANDIGLLKAAYEHYVHYTWVTIFNKEKKETGKHIRDEERKVLQTARERLREKRYRFAINNKFPKQYIDIITPIQAHSDDEYFPQKEVYVIKKLRFRSESANVFFRRLDEVMKATEKEDGKRAPTRRRVRVKNPPDSIFPKAPTGLPIDFYDVAWFNEKLPAQRQAIANMDVVAFLPNPLDSLRFKDPSENFKNKKFAEAHWDRAAKKYNLDFVVQTEPDSPSEDEDDSDYGGSIDLDDTDGEEEEEEEEEEESEDEVMQAGGSGTREVDENYDEYDNDDEEMDIENFGKGTLTGGLADNEWNAWQ